MFHVLSSLSATVTDRPVAEAYDWGAVGLALLIALLLTAVYFIVEVVIRWLFRRLDRVVDLQVPDTLPSPRQAQERFGSSSTPPGLS